MSGDSSQDQHVATDWEQRLLVLGSPERAKGAARFFRQTPGSYAEHDRFLGISVPVLRRLAKEAQSQVSHDQLASLLASPWNEVRLFACLVLVARAKKRKLPEERRSLAEWALAHREGVNNWNLVDTLIPDTIGRVEPSEAWVKTIEPLLRSEWLWDRRLAVLATLGWMRVFDRTDLVYRFVSRVLQDEEDLIHKAAGWMLREAGKRRPDELRAYLAQYAARMPRTMLRYAIERLSPQERSAWLAQKRTSNRGE